MARNSLAARVRKLRNKVAKLEQRDKLKNEEKQLKAKFAKLRYKA